MLPLILLIVLNEYLASFNLFPILQHGLQVRYSVLVLRCNLFLILAFLRVLLSEQLTVNIVSILEPLLIPLVIGTILDCDEGLALVQVSVQDHD